MGKKEPRIIKNVSHLTSSLEDVMYSSPQFTIQKEEGEIIR